jgi:phosphonoacetate hydrolase
MVAKLVETTISADSIRLRYADGSNLELELMRFQVPLSELKQPHDLKAYTAIGSRPEEHDLAGLTGHRLRSHGGLSEQPVPFMLSHPLNATYRAIARDRRLRNFDIFDFALNGTA